MTRWLLKHFPNNQYLIDHAARFPVNGQWIWFIAMVTAIVAYVGADAVDDNVDLRRCAAAAIRAFVDITTINGDQFDALSQCVATETDPTAASDLRNASAAANLGDDAAILDGGGASVLITESALDDQRRVLLHRFIIALRLHYMRGNI